MNLGNNIKYYREKEQITQISLSKKMHISRQTISNWETGRSYPDIESLVLLSNIFKCTLDALINNDYDLIKKIKVKKITQKVIKIICLLLLLADAIVLTINLISSRSVDWSLVTLSSTFFVMVFLGTFVNVKKWPMLKATIASYLPLLLIFLAIKVNDNNMNIYATLQVVSFWYIYYLFFVYLIEISRFHFYVCLWIFTCLSLPVEFITRIILDSSFSVGDLISKIVLIIIVTVFYFLNFKSNWLDRILNKYRKFAL